MKILYHHREASRDGMDVQMAELADAFAALGHEVIFVTPDIKIKPQAAARSRLAMEASAYAYNWEAYRGIARAIKAYKPDAIYERSAPFLMAGTWAKLKFGLPLALEVNAPPAETRGFYLQSFARRCERRAWRNADLCLPASFALAQHLFDAGIPEKRVAVTPAGVDTSEFSPSIEGGAARQRYGIGNRLVLGYCGQLASLSALEDIARLIAQLSGRADLHLLAVGDGPAREPLSRLAGELGVQDRVTVTGHIDRAQIPSHIAAFDIALQPDAPSHAAPRRVVEYMALGKAILAPDQPCISEVLENERTALLFERSNTEALRLGLLRLMTDKGLRDRLGGAAAIEVKRRPLTWVSNADHVATALKRALR